MGITYHPRFEKSKGLDTFDMNSWQSDIFGILHAACGARLAKGTFTNDPEQLDHNWIKPHVPFNAKADVARDMADVLRKSRPVWEIVYDRYVRPNMSEITFPEWIAWVEEWIHFLETSGGYRSI